MRHAWTVAAVMGLMAAWVADSSAISSGPGGMLYQSGRYAVGGVPSVRLGSLAVDKDWNVDWISKWTIQGTVTDNTLAGTYGENYKREQGCSPEIVSTTGGAGYATIVLGAHYNRNPQPTGPANNTLDILQLTTSASGMSASVLGDGKAYVNSTTGFTEGGVFALPDPKGGFTGSASNYFVGARYGSTDYRCYAVVSDTVADGDPTNTAADYVAKAASYIASTVYDWEIQGRRAYCVADYSYMEAGTDGLFYYQRESDGSISRNAFYYDRDGEANGGVKTGGTFNVVEGCGIAVGKVGGHEAAWGVCLVGGVLELALFVDRDDDGNALDSDEYTLAKYNNATVATGWNNMSNSSSWTDLELLTGADGKKFLLIQDTYNMDNRGRAYMAMELADNGEYVGSADGIKLLLWEKGAGDGSRGYTYNQATGWYMMADSGIYNETEFDAVAVPEPATLILIGTGALGVVGCIRRRSMN